jgi:predicted metalloprotease
MRVRPASILRGPALALVAALVLAGCSATVAGHGALDAPAVQPTSSLTVVDDGHTDFDRLAKNALTDVEAFWTTNYPLVSGGKALPALAGGIYSVDDQHLTTDDSDNACLKQEPDIIQDNAFYCSLDDSIAYDRVGLVPQLAQKYGSYMVALVFAHEFGHAIQARLGISKNRSTIYKESQADCAAGAFTASVLNFRSPYFRISAADLEKVLVGYIQLRDPAGTDASESGSHGDGFDRLSALADGINKGVTYCYAADWDKRTFTERPFTSDSDYASGGNETEAEVLNPGTADAGGGGLQPSLNDFWTAQAKTIGKTFTPVKIAKADHPPCLVSSGATTDSEFGYCASDNTVYYSQSIADKAYVAGDYALGTLFVYGWGLAVRHQLFARSTDDEPALLAAGCYAGAYSKSVNTTDSQTFQLSPPDMDEAAVAVLTMVANPLAFGPRDTTGLDRIESFKTGYSGGLTAC